MPRAHPSHRLIDVSYHGSPTYICEFCDTADHAAGIADPCPRAAEARARESARAERAERAEYAALLAARARFEYLHAKYGDPHGTEDPEREHGLRGAGGWDQCWDNLGRPKE